jgi:nucleotide-binding universal stress UspA family protein
MADHITRILVPVDFSMHADQAIEFATTIAQRFGGAVELLHVVEDPFVSGAWSAEAFTPNIPELMDQLIADARRRVDAIKAAAATDGVAFAADVKTGEPAPTIVEQAKTGAFDLIVMSTHGRTGLTHLFLGSVAERVLRTAPCPVLTVRAVNVRTRDARVDTATAAS